MRTVLEWQSLGAVRGPSGMTLVLNRHADDVGGAIHGTARSYVHADGRRILTRRPVISITSNIGGAAQLNNFDPCTWYADCGWLSISAVRPGVATVRAELEGAADEIEVTVEPAVGSLVVTPMEVTLRVGESAILTAQWLDDEGG